MKRLLVPALATVIAVASAACGNGTPTETKFVQPTSTLRPLPSATHTAMAALVPLPTTLPTATREMTASPTATAHPTATLSPTALPTVLPTAAPTATPTAIPTATVYPTATTPPTATMFPTAQPTASRAATPTATAYPTATPTTFPTAPLPSATTSPTATTFPTPTLPPSATSTPGALEQLTTTLWSGLRTQRYEGYPESFSGYVSRSGHPDGTSETQGLFALLECGYGEMTLCRKILDFSDSVWVGGQSTFPWAFDKDARPTKGTDSATDGDLALLWSAMRAFERTGDEHYRSLYGKWSPSILELDTCTYDVRVVIASGSGIGRDNACDRFNGTYSAYVMLPLLADLAAFDASWQDAFDGAVKQLYDAFTLHGGIMPPRCAAYDGASIDIEQCELNPNYTDQFDAQRAILWAGLMAKRDKKSPELDQLRAHLSDAVQLAGSVYELPVNGFELDGTARGETQFNEFGAALWLPAIDYARGEGAQVIEQISEKWSGTDFYGTGCTEPGKTSCLDEFKDALILTSLIMSGYD